MVKLNTLKQLEMRLSDANRLISIHVEMTGDGPGRRYEVDVLNRSAVILAVAAWESFVEDLAIRNCSALARRLKKADDLPDAIRVPLLVWLFEQGKFSGPTKSAQDTMWSLAGHGWRGVLRDFAKEKTRNLNTPSSDNVVKLFRCTLAIQDISLGWGYRRWGHQIYRDKMDELLKLRHRVAHGAITTETVGKTQAKEAVSLIRSLGERSVSQVSQNFRSFDLQGKRAKIRPA